MNWRKNVAGDSRFTEPFAGCALPRFIVLSSSSLEVSCTCPDLSPLNVYNISPKSNVFLKSPLNSNQAQGLMLALKCYVSLVPFYLDIPWPPRIVLALTLTSLEKPGSLFQRSSFYLESGSHFLIESFNSHFLCPLTFLRTGTRPTRFVQLRPHSFSRKVVWVFLSVSLPVMEHLLLIIPVVVLSVA